METTSDNGLSALSINASVARFILKISGFDDLRVVKFTGEEGLSRLFQFQLTIASEDEAINFDDIVGKPVTLIVHSQDETEPRLVNAIISRLQQRETSVRFMLYEMGIVPVHWLLSYRQNSRIFQNQAITDIISTLLKEANIPSDQFAFDLQGSYEPREYCVQYEESDWNFISRLLEEEGIHYFFEHTEDLHKLVMADNAFVHQNIIDPAELPYSNRPGLISDDTHIQKFFFAESICSGAVLIKDFDFKKPALDLATPTNADKNSELEVYHYPAAFIDPARGDQLAKARLQSLQAQRFIGEGLSDSQRLVPGYLFSLTEHPRETFNREYLITRVSHQAQQPQVLEEDASGSGIEYRAEFTCIPSDQPYRPQQKAKKGKVEGLQTAMVVGPGGEEIYTDEHGRVKVQFHWDRQGANDEHSSCWIRVAQLWAGASWGAMYIPRIGQEVIVDFLEGNPDRPIITGRVYHGTNKPPYPLPAEKTKSTIKSNSSKGGGGSNEIRFEDKAGAEEIYVHGQKDWTIAIENDKNQTIGHDETLSVGNDRSKDVGNNQSETIGSNKSINVGSNHDETIGADKTLTVGANHTESIGSNMSLSVGSNKTETVAINSAETIGVAKELTIGAAYQVTVGAAMNETVAAIKAEEVGANKTVAVGANMSETIGGNASTSAGKDISVSAGKDITIKSAKKMMLSAGDDLGVKGDKKGVIEVKDELTIKCGKAMIQMKKNGDITIKGNKINIKGSGNITIKGKKILEN